MKIINLLISHIEDAFIMPAKRAGGVKVLRFINMVKYLNRNKAA